MSSTSSAELAALASGLNGPECEPSPSAKSTSTVVPFSRNTGLAFQFTTTSEHSQGTNSQELPLTSSAADSLVRTSLSRVLERVSKVRDQVYGLITLDLFASYDPALSSWKTSQHCLVEGLETFSETWPRSGTMQSGIAYRLPTLAPLTLEIASGLLPTPRRSGQSRGWKAYVRKNYQGNLEEYLGEIGLRGWINPKFVEWMIGLPTGWTATSRLATRSSRKSRKSSDVQS